MTPPTPKCVHCGAPLPPERHVCCDNYAVCRAREEEIRKAMNLPVSGPTVTRSRHVLSLNHGPIEVGLVEVHSAPEVRDRPFVTIRNEKVCLNLEPAEAAELAVALTHAVGQEHVSHCQFSGCLKPRDYTAKDGEYPLYANLCKGHYDLLDDLDGWRSRSYVMVSGCSYCQFGQGWPPKASARAPHSPECMGRPYRYVLDTSTPAGAGGGGGSGRPHESVEKEERKPCVHPVTLDRKEYGTLVRRTCGVCGEVLAGSVGFSGSVGAPSPNGKKVIR